MIRDSDLKTEDRILIGLEWFRAVVEFNYASETDQNNPSNNT